MSEKICFFTCGDREHAFTAMTLAKSFKRHNIPFDFFVFADRPILDAKGAFPIGDLKKLHIHNVAYSFKMTLFNEVRIRAPGYSHYVWLDSDSSVVRQFQELPSYILKDPMFVFEERRLIPGEPYQWYGSSPENLIAFAASQGIGNALFNSNGGFVCARSEFIPAMLDEFTTMCVALPGSKAPGLGDEALFSLLHARHRTTSGEGKYFSPDNTVWMCDTSHSWNMRSPDGVRTDWLLPGPRVPGAFDIIHAPWAKELLAKESRKLHIFIPCTRHDKVEASVGSVLRSEAPKLFNTETHVVFDVIKAGEPAESLVKKLESQGVLVTRASAAGYSVGKNDLLNTVVQDGWIYVVDDDNLLHPEFPAALKNAIHAHPAMRALMVSQEDRYRATVEGCRAGVIDTAMLCVERTFVGDTRWNNKYGEDGAFIEELLNKNREAFVFLNEDLCYYNKQTQPPKPIEGSLGSLFDKHGSDKHRAHRYNVIYEKLLEPLKNEEFNMLEVGVNNGGSVLAWREWFPRAYIYGVDIKLPTRNMGERIILHQADSTHDANANTLLAAGLRFKVIIDDGDHHPYAQLRTMLNYLPLLADGGLYVIEDVNPPQEEAMRSMLRNARIERTSHLSGCNHSTLLIIPKESV